MLTCLFEEHPTKTDGRQKCGDICQTTLYLEAVGVEANIIGKIARSK